ncbi:MAG: PEP-CTERM sorting domain-containing protein [Planctomycetaceae bacterium]|nr:PEP-CTERM sorting domain-containing protein [Planctomycetaceae bacterium]
MLALAGSASAAVYTVTSTADDGSEGTLRWAITQAQANGGADTINITATGTITLGSTWAGAPRSAFYISDALTITGSGVTIAGNNTFRFASVYNTSLDISGVTFTNFNATGGNGGSVSRCPGGGGALGAGGVIFANQANLTISDVTFSGNTAKGGNGGEGGGSSTSTGGGPGGGGMGGNGANAYYGAGGAANDPSGLGAGPAGSNSGAAGNFGAGASGPANKTGKTGGFGGGGSGGSRTQTAAGAGGFGGGNGGNGGGAQGAGGGGAGMGGAIFMLGGTATISNSDFINNSALLGLGGTYQQAQDGQGLGGAIFNANGVLTVSETTFDGNAAAQGAANVYGFFGTTGVINNTGSVTLINSPDAFLASGSSVNYGFVEGTTWTEITIAIPEPATMGLLVLGGVAVLVRRRRVA